MLWVESVDRLSLLVSDILSGKEPIVEEELLLSAFKGYLSSSLCEYTEGASEAYSRRLVWAFNNDYILTIGTGINPTITHLTKELSETSPMPFPDSIEQSNWSFLSEANAWSRNEDLTDEELLEFLQNLSNEAGEKPNLILPLEWKLDSIEDYEEYKDDPDMEDYYTFYKLGKLLSDENSLEILNSILPWGSIEIVEESDYMSYYSQAEKFERFINFLQETGKWIVILDEHCAACSRGSVEDAISYNPELKDAPVFMTWGQNSNISHLPDGTFWAEVYINEEADEKFIKQHARTFGLDVGDWEDGKFEPYGSVTFGS